MHDALAHMGYTPASALPAAMQMQAAARAPGPGARCPAEESRLGLRGHDLQVEGEVAEKRSGGSSTLQVRIYRMLVSKVE
jgi:hypothetical protein